MPEPDKTDHQKMADVARERKVRLCKIFDEFVARVATDADFRGTLNIEVPAKAGDFGSIKYTLTFYD